MNKEKVYLFDGTDLSGWKSRWSGNTPDWKVEDGIATVGHEDIVSDYQFSDAHIHVEFRIPDMPDCTGQAKGNSGVYAAMRSRFSIPTASRIRATMIAPVSTAFRLRFAMHAFPPRSGRPTISSSELPALISTAR